MPCRSLISPFCFSTRTLFQIVKRFCWEKVVLTPVHTLSSRRYEGSLFFPLGSVQLQARRCHRIIITVCISASIHEECFYLPECSCCALDTDHQERSSNRQENLKRQQRSPFEEFPWNRVEIVFCLTPGCTSFFLVYVLGQVFEYLALVARKVSAAVVPFRKADADKVRRAASHALIDSMNTWAPGMAFRSLNRSFLSWTRCDRWLLSYRVQLMSRYDQGLVLLLLLPLLYRRTSQSGGKNISNWEWKWCP